MRFGHPHYPPPSGGDDGVCLLPYARDGGFAFTAPRQAQVKAAYLGLRIKDQWERPVKISGDCLVGLVVALVKERLLSIRSRFRFLGHANLRSVTGFF